MAHFVSKKGFDIDGLGNKVVVQLLENGVIEDPADLFKLQQEDFMQLELFKDKRSENLVSSIEKAKNIPLERFLFALGIRFLGEQGSYDFAKYLYSHRPDTTTFNIPELKSTLENLTLEQMLNIDGFGEKMAQSIYDWFQQEENLKYLDKLHSVGVQLDPTNLSSSGELNGKGFVVTGTLENYTRDQAKQVIKEKGGKILSSVSKNTDYLVVGESPGSKLKKAQDLGVAILDESAFEKLLRG